MSSIAYRIALAIATLCEAVQQSAGYATDAGLRVYVGMQTGFSADDLVEGPVIVVNPGGPDGDFDEPVQATPQKLRNRVSHAITAAARLDNTDALSTGHQLLADLKRALLRTDTPRPLDAGEILGEEITYAGARVELPAPGEQVVSVTVTVTCGYSERRGDPAST